MNEETYSVVEDAIQSGHWWFECRRRLVRRQLTRLALPSDTPSLDIGTSTGVDLRLMRDLGMSELTGVDVSELATRFCKEERLARIVQADCRHLPFETGAFKLALAADVLEHVEHDQKAVVEFNRILAPGGRILVTVPAFKSLWGLEDEVAQHYRRYRLGQLRKLFADAGFSIETSFYFNYLLFLPIWLARRIIRAVGMKLESETQLNTRLLNHALKAVFMIDIATAPWIKPPLGVSILMMAVKDAQQGCPGAAPTTTRGGEAEAVAGGRRHNGVYRAVCRCRTRAEV